MTSFETSFVHGNDLIIVEAQVTSSRTTLDGRFVLDTGAVLTTMTPEFADLLGYSARDGVRRTRVHTAIGAEDGYLLHVAGFAVLGFAVANFSVHVFDLGHDDIHGLVGLNFLSRLNYEVRSAERRILTERIAG